MATKETDTISLWKTKRLIASLKDAHGNGTSLISLIIPPTGKLAIVRNKLCVEYGTAENIKSRVNRLSVMGAISSTQQRLKLYNSVPTNGLVIYCGTIETEKGEKKVCIDFEPFKPINTTLYLCDSRFHVEPLGELMKSDETFGFIIINGKEALFATLCGNNKMVLERISEDLPKKHNKGGQSATRFAHLRDEKIHNYIRKLSEKAVRYFISDDKVWVSGIILAGSADMKNDLEKSDLMDKRLKEKIISTVDIAYSGLNGLNQAIELSADKLTSVQFIKEKCLLERYFESIAKDSKKITIGVKETMQAFDLGIIDTLIVYENLNIQRVVTEKTTDYLTTEQLSKNKEKIVAITSLAEWIADNYSTSKMCVEFVSDHSSLGNQFVKGFGGIGALLRYEFTFECQQDDDFI